MIHSKTVLLLATTFVALLGVASPAFADAVNPDVAACYDLDEGDACTVDSFPLISDGVCVTRNQRQCDPNYYECISHIDDPGCDIGSGSASGSGEGSGDCVTEAECAAMHCEMVDRLVCETRSEGSGGDAGRDDDGGCVSSGKRLNTTGLLSLAFGALLVWSARRRKT